MLSDVFFLKAEDGLRNVAVTGVQTCALPILRNLVAALGGYAAVSVVSPVPYAPPLPRRARWAALRSVPHRSRDGERDVFHPRFRSPSRLRCGTEAGMGRDRKSTRPNSSHGYLSHAVCCSEHNLPARLR